MSTSNPSVNFSSEPRTIAKTVTTAARPAKRPQTTAPEPSRTLRTAGLFAGVGGLELGLERAGHETVALCEIDKVARAVLDEHFDAEPSEDVLELKVLPEGTQLITAGFPCQDLSQCGRTLGLGGSRSTLVGEVFRLLRTHDVPWVLLENVPFMLKLAKGETLRVIVETLEELEYRWAYRVINTQAFGLPQRRERVYIVASKHEDPRDVLLSKDAGAPEMPTSHEGVACGFYWTEGNGGLGWAVDAVPTLKSGSTIGIASPPAIWLPSGEIVTPGIRDAEKLQGFPPDWTEPAEKEGKPSLRWKLVGNSVTVDVAEWLGQQLLEPGKYGSSGLDAELDPRRPWPRAAYNVEGKGGRRFAASVSAFPVRCAAKPLAEFINMSETAPLSLRAVSGFLSRFEASTLRKPDGFVPALRAYKARLERQKAG